MPNYFFTVRKPNDNGNFSSDIGTTTYLSVPEDADDLNFDDKIADPNEWLDQIINQSKEDILIYVHGYNNNSLDVVKAHKSIKKGLMDLNFKGQVISFDWPCGNNALMYLPDRHQAKLTAIELVKGGIVLLSQRQNNKCEINVHLLAHSTGAFVVREAFDDAIHTKAVIDHWMVTQMMFIEGDISSSSLNVPGDCNAIYDHVIRLTNYFNPYDCVLAMSNLKRVGTENRVGRVGLPPNAPGKYVDVNCGEYYQSIKNNSTDPFYSHSFYFDSNSNGMFMKDLLGTINGDTDRNYMPTRDNRNGDLFLNTR